MDLDTIRSGLHDRISALIQQYRSFGQFWDLLPMLEAFLPFCP
jgi:hypothetical protein